MITDIIASGPPLDAYRIRNVESCSLLLTAASLPLHRRG